MYLDLNYTDLTNISRTVQLMSGGFDLVANGMGQKDVCLHAWLVSSFVVFPFSSICNSRYQMSGGPGYKSELLAALRLFSFDINKYLIFVSSGLMMA